MPQFRLIIDLNGNKEMMMYSDIAESIRRSIHYCLIKDTHKGDIRDRNGNVVGHYEVVDS